MISTTLDYLPLVIFSAVVAFSVVQLYNIATSVKRIAAVLEDAND